MNNNERVALVYVSKLAVAIAMGYKGQDTLMDLAELTAGTVLLEPIVFGPTETPDERFLKQIETAVCMRLLEGHDGGLMDIFTQVPVVARDIRQALDILDVEDGGTNAQVAEAKTAYLTALLKGASPFNKFLHLLVIANVDLHSVIK